jgi:hypothetical protein
MCSINAKEIEKRNTIPPAQKEKSTSQNCHHRKNIDHKINEKITWQIFFVRNKHFSGMLRKVPDTISVEEHKAYRHILAVPPEELQDSPGISVAMLHKHSHQFSNIYVLYQPLDFGFLFLCH